MIGNDKKSRGDQSKANKLDAATPERAKALGEKLGFRLSTGLPLHQDQRAILSSQRRDLRKGHVFRRNAISLDAVVRIKEHEVRFTDRVD